MNAEIINGILVITPDSHTEAYALSHWKSCNIVDMYDVMRGEDKYYRASGIVVGGYN